MDTIYSQTVCPACVKLKKEYQLNGKEFKEIVIGEDITVDDFKKLFPTVRTVPFVVKGT